MYPHLLLYPHAWDYLFISYILLAKFASVKYISNIFIYGILSVCVFFIAISIFRSQTVLLTSFNGLYFPGFLWGIYSFLPIAFLWGAVLDFLQEHIHFLFQGLYYLDIVGSLIYASVFGVIIDLGGDLSVCFVGWVFCSEASVSLVDF